MSLSVIVPVYNESKNIKKTIKNLSRLKKVTKKFEVVFIDDFSDDNTFKIINDFSKKKKFCKNF